jgi:hypothetical protein
VIARAAADDARRAAVAERGDLGERAAQLERAGALQVLGLQRDRPAAALTDSVRELSTGVSRITPATRRGARRCRMSASDGEDGQSGSATTASISTCAPARQRRHADRHPRRRLGLEERRVDLVDRRERRHVGQVHVTRTASPDLAPAAPQTAARFSRHRPACSAAVPADELAGPGVERDLARAEQQAAGAHRVHVGARSRRARLGR